MRRCDQYAVYLLRSKTGTLYIGVTSDLMGRVLQHKRREGSKFTSKYGIDQLVYYELTTDVRAAIAREKEIKGWRRSKKVALVEALNPKWKDLSEDWSTPELLQAGEFKP